MTSAAIQRREGKRVKILHVITGLNTGGAEMMLYSLLSHIDRHRFFPRVICLNGVGQVGERIRALDIPVWSPSSTDRRLTPLGWLYILRDIRKDRPDILQTWLYHADLFGGLAGRLAGIRRIVWSVHGSGLDRASTKTTTIAVARLCAMLSGRIPVRIVFCAEESLRLHLQFGYCTRNTSLIPNGFDIEKFRADPEARRSVRVNFGIPANAPVIGMVARYAPEKDHATFIKAAAILLDRFPQARFLLIGDGVDWENNELRRAIEKAGIAKNTILTGVRPDIPRLLAAMDVLGSSSYREAFPMAIGEAMATSVPCVVTNVGDCALMVGDTGLAVPPSSPQALAQGWESILTMNAVDRKELGTASRRRVEQNFSIAKVTRKYEALYDELVLADSQQSGSARSH